MKTYAHLLSSWRRIKKLDPVIYKTKKYIAFKLCKEIHLWLDEFYNKKTQDSDYSCYPLSHREARHHKEGIEDCVSFFIKRYGLEYSKVIRRETSKHVEDDLHFIPQKQDYFKKDFWENWSLRYEWFLNE